MIMGYLVPMTNLDIEVGEAVHRLMFRRRITQTSLCKSMGMTQSTLSKKLHGERKWTLEDVYSAASALNVPLDELLPRLDSNQQPSDYKSGPIPRAA